MREKITVQWQKISPYLSAFILCFLAFLFLMVCGSPHYATNDDVTLNNIAAGNYGEQNRPYLVFGNICYGYVLTILYDVVGGVNWYGVFPIILSVCCFLIVAYLLTSQTKTAMASVLSFLFTSLFAYFIVVEVQFTHFAAFFSAVGLFLMYACLFKNGKRYCFLNVFGVMVSLFGFWIRRDAFLSVAAIIGICCLIKVIQNKFWKLKLKEIFKQASAFIVLVALILVSGVLNHVAYQEDEGWRFWTEYNTYRASLLDYPLPDYNTYSDAYQEIGVDKLDFEMLCTWNYADLNKFSMETMKDLYDLQQRVKQDSFELTEVFKQFVRDICNSFLSTIAFPVLLIICIIYMLWDKKNLWFAFPIGMLGAELFYLSYSGRFIFRSYLGLWISLSLVIFLSLSEEKNLLEKFKKRHVIAVIGGMLAFQIPWMFEVWHNHYAVDENLRVQKERYAWREILSKDEDALYLCETLFGGVPGSLNPLELVGEYNHNLYSFGGWTCPAPLEQYLLEKYEIQEEGVMRGLLNDEKNVFYIEMENETSRYRLIEYLRKEYDKRVEMELVNSVGNICIYRFYIQSTENLEEAIEDSDIEYGLEVTKSGENYELTGWCSYYTIEPYKQDVWLKVSYDNNEKEEQYIKCKKMMRNWLGKITEDLHMMAAGIDCTVDSSLLQKDCVVELIIECGETIVTTDVTSYFNELVQ